MKTSTLHLCVRGKRLPPRRPAASGWPTKKMKPRRAGAWRRTHAHAQAGLDRQPRKGLDTPHHTTSAAPAPPAGLRRGEGGKGGDSLTLPSQPVEYEWASSMLSRLRGKKNHIGRCLHA